MPQLTDKEIEAITREAEKMLPISEWSGDVPPGTDLNKFPRHVYQSLLKRERLNQKYKDEQIKVYRGALEKILNTRRQAGTDWHDWMNTVVSIIEQTLNQFKEK